MHRSQCRTIAAANQDPKAAVQPALGPLQAPQLLVRQRASGLGRIVMKKRIGLPAPLNWSTRASPEPVDSP